VGNCVDGCDNLGVCKRMSVCDVDSPRVCNSMGWCDMDTPKGVTMGGCDYIYCEWVNVLMSVIWME
jgi:hypothetical protein